MSGLIEFPSGERRRQIAPASIPRTRSQRDKLFLEIIEDRRRPVVFLCVVQEEGSPEILFLGQAWTRSEAASAADEFIEEYLSRRKALGKPAA